MNLNEYFIYRLKVKEEVINNLRQSLEHRHSDEFQLSSIGEELVKKGYISEEELVKAYIETMNVPFSAVDELSTQRDAARLIPYELCQKYGLIAFKKSDKFLHIAMKNPGELIAITKVREATGEKIKVYAGFISQINRTISEIFGQDSADIAIKQMSSADEATGGILDDSGGGVDGSHISIDKEDGNEEGAIAFVNSILKRAITEKASDIHIEPSKESFFIRIRVDGILQDIQKAPIKLFGSVAARIKVMGQMDVAEKRVPQDGRCAVLFDAEEMDLRISSLPTIYGEKIVIRLLKKSAAYLSKEAIGLKGEDINKFDRLLQNHSGVILMVGPTGSGKSTTMVTMLKSLNTRDVNIITLEDPVEYEVPGVSQVQINTKTGMTFAKGLRAAMRQDPDIICVGEIRDGETAEIAMRAAITGHLVISTLHTSDAPSAFERLVDMGTPPYLIGPAVIGVISQRLVRKLCPHCKNGSKAIGCPACHGSGYIGRAGVFEILTVDKKLREAVTAGANYNEIMALARQGDYVDLKTACRKLIDAGITSEDEYRRITNSID